MWWLITKPVLNPRADGGAYAHLIATSDGSALWKDIG